MELELSLIEEFAKKHPIYTSKLFALISLKDLLYILQNINLNATAKVLEKMSPKNALELISRFSDDNQTKILRILKSHSLVPIFRFLSKKDMEVYLKKLSYIERAKVELQLKYELDEVGAWMNINAPQANSDYSVSELKKYLEEHYSNELFREVYVVDNKGSLEGVLNLNKALLASDNIKIGSIAKQIKYSLSPRLKLDVVQNHVGFKKYDRLPVISKDNKILGAFSYVNLKAGLSHGSATGLTMEEESIEGYGIYGDTLLSLLNIK